MIKIGFEEQEKCEIIKKYLANNKNIKKIFIFYFKDLKSIYDIDMEIEYVEYKDIEMYKYFYRLLEEINNDTLLIVDELLRTQNRQEL